MTAQAAVASLPGCAALPLEGRLQRRQIEPNWKSEPLASEFPCPRAGTYVELRSRCRQRRRPPDLVRSREQGRCQWIAEADNICHSFRRKVECALRRASAERASTVA